MCRYTYDMNDTSERNTFPLLRNVLQEPQKTEGSLPTGIIITVKLTSSMTICEILRLH